MPLAFESESHGTIAFGFFNIESDMLLLDHCFFFATDFCEVICHLFEEQGGGISGLSIPVWIIEDPASIGDLHGGIAGTHYSGFIGETYRKYPFPEDQRDFKQQTDGFKTRSVFTQLIQKYGTANDLDLYQDNNRERVSLGPYVFSQDNFSQLISYVIRGGYPRWLDGIAPAYVVKMQKKVTAMSTE